MTKIACIAVLCMMALVAPHAQAVITCLDVSLHVAVCVPYLTNKGPLGGCCDGVKSLNLLATTTKDRQIICNCLKANANIIAGIDWIKARSLPATCNVNIPYLISAQLDCAKYVLLSLNVNDMLILSNYFKWYIDILHHIYFWDIGAPPSKN